ncbi:branched-chain amino acid aminotransferase [Aureitalea marina]|uniref:Branched-chain-amino-acid aminotransferase n=1 Tax=Aureitalea marina TaxID=930804 RepID=A0A2S7KQX5_9FLAO|nr:branched-chain amino acid aminotransferase [Aureitalea marina]PQB05025.1 branched chain amino acid aminotransferase [Aureitalea marina]
MTETNTNISIKQVQQSRVYQLDFDNIPLGTAFTDHMFVCDYTDGQWQNPQIQPMGLIPTHPAAMALHYGQAIFEGMKATVGADGIPRLFRPEMNAARLNFSARRLGMPDFPEDLFVEGLKALVKLEQNWIPKKEGSALYLRPFMYADEAFIGMRAATSYKFLIIASPSGPFFSRPIRLWAEKKYIRAAEGGTGQAKAAGNYAAAIRPTEIAKDKGFDQVLWLDAHEHRFIQEVGTMNIFFMIDGKIVTPALDGAILDGVTRRSVIELLVDFGYEVAQRAVTIEEVHQAAIDGTLQEAFGTGTAVGIAYIKEIGWGEEIIPVSDSHPLGERVNMELNKIKNGQLPDRFNWVVKCQ